MFKCKIEKASFLAEFNSTVMLSKLKYLVCSLGTELNKLTSGSEESLTSKKSSESKGLKRWFSKSWTVLGAVSFIYNKKRNDFKMDP